MCRQSVSGHLFWPLTTAWERGYHMSCYILVPHGWEQGICSSPSLWLCGFAGTSITSLVPWLSVAANKEPGYWANPLLTYTEHRKGYFCVLPSCFPLLKFPFPSPSIFPSQGPQPPANNHLPSGCFQKDQMVPDSDKLFREGGEERLEEGKGCSCSN